MVALLGFALLAGLVTVLSPCVWPILPIVLSSSASGAGSRKPLGITLGIVLTFGALTLFLSTLVRTLHFDPGTLRWAAIVAIGAIGLTMLVPAISGRLEGFLSRVSGRFGHDERKGTGFVSGLLTGISLGIVWSPCAGPVLAAIAAAAATGKVTWSVIMVTLAYVTGIGVPLFALAAGGRRLITRSRFLSRYTGRIQQAFGALMIVFAAGMATNYDTLLEAKLLSTFPGLNVAAGIDQSTLGPGGPDAPQDGTGAGRTVVAKNGTLFNADLPAPDLAGISGWLNTKSPLSLKGLRGKVVLVDFWTYTCINCIRTLPHVTSWYEKYKDNGFVVIGVHTPEFPFEHDADNVRRAIGRYEISYPVALDNDYGTWNNFQNQYWPAEYLIDAEGRIRRTHFGEGEYDEMEEAIRELLEQNGRKISGPLEGLVDQTPEGALSPETYLGADRMEDYVSGGQVKPGEQQFVLAGTLRQSTFSFGGSWDVRPECAVAGRDAVLKEKFFAHNVFLVLRTGSAGTGARVRVFLDGMEVTPMDAGPDVHRGEVTVDADRLYSLIHLKGNAGSHELELRFEKPGVEAYAFTFG